MIPVWFATPGGLRWLLRATAVLLLAGLASAFTVGAARPADPHLLPMSASAGLGGHSSPTSRVSGFGRINFRVVSAGGGVGSLRCALLADKPAARQQGMQGRRDLAGYDAMVFRWLGTTTDGFINHGVPIPLTVAWFDSAGVLVGSADMPVCDRDCPTYGPGVAFHLALEVPRGGLRQLGVGPGTVLLLGSSC